jgi:ketosteroid isomerase-like protein
MKRWLWVVVILACKKPDDTGAKPAPVTAARGDAAVARPGLELDKPEEGGPEVSLGVAFDGKVPRLPAVSADGKTVATFDSPAGMPSIPEAFDLVIMKVDGADEVARLPILTADESLAAEHQGTGWATPQITDTLHKRAAAALAKLDRFRSLVDLQIATDSMVAQPTRVGDTTITIDEQDDAHLVVTLRDKRGVLHREEVQAYDQGTRNVGLDKPVPCTYRPALVGAYRDPGTRTLYVQIGFRYSEECDQAQRPFIAWPLDTPPLPDRALVTEQFDVVGINNVDRDSLLLPDAAAITTGRITSVDDLKSIGVAEHAMDYGGHDDKNVQIVISRDGQSAWASELANVTLLETNTAGRDTPWRASDVIVMTPKGWRIAALAWTEPVANAEANRQAKAGKLAASKLEGAPGDQSLRDAFAKLTTDGVDAAAAARDDLVAIGSGPGERTVGGPAFARPWTAAWKGKVTIISSVAHTTPSGTTGWVAATIELARPGYKLPFTVFAVFDKTADGQWSLVHIHFSV